MALSFINGKSGFGQLRIDLLEQLLAQTVFDYKSSFYEVDRCAV